MGRHTVGDKRGSVRGMPGQNYLPFGDYHNRPEPWQDVIRLAKHFLAILGIWLVLFAIVVVVVAVGLLPDTLLDEL